MKTIIILVFFCFSCLMGMAQHKVADSLIMIKGYLQEIEAAIPRKSSETDSAIIKLQNLIRKGTDRQALLERQFDSFIRKDTNSKKELVQKYRLVVQSAILLKTDLQQSGFDNDGVRGEIRYLRQQLPPLADKLYYFSKRAIAAAEAAKHQ